MLRYITVVSVVISFPPILVHLSEFLSRSFLNWRSSRFVNFLLVKNLLLISLSFSLACFSSFCSDLYHLPPCADVGLSLFFSTYLGCTVWWFICDLSFLQIQAIMSVSCSLRNPLAASSFGVLCFQYCFFQDVFKFPFEFFFDPLLVQHFVV